MFNFLRPIASHASSARMQLKRILKLAAALAAFWMLVFTNPSTAATELVTNGNFDNTYPTAFFPSKLPYDWPTNFGQAQPKVGPTLTYCFTNFVGCGWGEDSVAESDFYRWGSTEEYPADYVTGTILSQVINGLKIGQKYAVSYSSWGWGTIRDQFTDGGYWQVSLTDSKGRTQTQNGAKDLIPPDFHSASSWVGFFKRRTAFFTATDIMETLGFAVGAGPAISNPYCVPCYPRQDMYIDSISMTEVSSPPVLTVNKALSGNRVADSDQFTVQILQNNSAVNATTNSTTTGTGSTVTAGTGTTGLTTLVTGTSYTITEVASGTTKMPQYSSTLACTDATGASKALSLNTPFTLADGDAITCTLTNTPKAPTLRLTKALGTAGRINNADQFTVLVGQRLTTLASATTTGTGGVVNTGSTAWTNLVPGVSYSLSEVMTGSSVSSLGQYSAVLSCSNTWMHGPECCGVQKPVATGAGRQLHQQCGHHSGQLCGEQREAAMRRICIAADLG